MVAKSPVKGTTRRFVVEGSLCTLNEYTHLTRANKQASAALKRKQEEIVGWAIKQYLGNWHTDKPIRVRFLWIEKNKRKDKDNIAFAKKFIFDALVKCGTINDDKWDMVEGFEDDFAVDKLRPRVEVEIFEL